MFEDFLEHHGVKGMKWGVRKDKPTLRDHVNSLRRERQWKKVVSEVDNLTTKEITSVARRVSLENDLKRLSRNKSIARQSDKNDYTYREKLSDDDLAQKVTRLRAKEHLATSVSSASKEQREIGEKIVNAGGALTLKYATTKSLTPKDVFDAVKNPKPIKDRAVKDLVDQLTKKERSGS